MKEYTQVMRPIVEALEIFQGEKKIVVNYIPPTKTCILKSKVSIEKDDLSVIHCQPLISGFVDPINLR